MDEYLHEQSELGRFSGTALVEQGDRTILKRGYGETDRERGLSNTPQTEFQIASISKQFTAGAVLLLQQRGLLSVQDRICRWVPDCPDTWESITIHQLLTHTSGIGHWEDFPDLSLVEPNTVEYVIETFQRGPLKFPPGTGWSYSSPAYVLLAHIVEQVSSQPYVEFLRDHIFRPLGMDGTGAGNSAPHSERQSVGYEGTEPVRSFELDVVGMGAGDIWSTVEDLARWNRAVSAPGLLTEPSLRSMFAPHATTTDPLPDGSETQYGYGWSMGELAGHRVLFHTGGNAGFRSINIRFPDDDAIVVLLSNDATIDLERISMRIAGELLGVEMGSDRQA